MYNLTFYNQKPFDGINGMADLNGPLQGRFGYSENVEWKTSAILENHGMSNILDCTFCMLNTAFGFQIQENMLIKVQMPMYKE